MRKKIANIEPIASTECELTSKQITKYFEKLSNKCRIWPGAGKRSRNQFLLMGNVRQSIVK